MKRVIMFLFVVLLVSLMVVPVSAATVYDIPGKISQGGFRVYALIPAGYYTLTVYTDTDVYVSDPFFVSDEIVWSDQGLVGSCYSYLDHEFVADLGVFACCVLTTVRGDYVETFVNFDGEGEGLYSIERCVLTLQPLSTAAAGTDMTSVFSQILALLPIVVPVLVAYIALRKSISFLCGFLSRC